MKTKNIFRMLLVAVALLLGANNVKADETPTTYTITLDYDNTKGSVSCQATSQGYEQIHFTVTPNEGYEVASVTVTDANGTALNVWGNYDFYLNASNVTVTVTFREVQAQTPTEYTITLDYDNTKGSVSCQATSQGYEQIHFTVTPNEGFEVASVTVTDTNSKALNVWGDYDFYLEASNVTVSVTFRDVQAQTPTEYTITLDYDNTKGSVSCQATSQGDEQIHFTVTPNEGYEVASVTVTDASGTSLDVWDNYTFYLGASNVTVSVTFREAGPVTYSVWNANDIQNGSVSANTNTAVEGTIITLSNQPNTGYELDYYTVTDANGNAVAVNGNQFTMPANNVWISAVFKQINYTITINETTNGTVSADKTTNVHYNDEVTLTVNPAEGYELDVLTVKDANNNNVNVNNNKFNMPASNVTVTATFKQTGSGPVGPTIPEDIENEHSLWTGSVSATGGDGHLTETLPASLFAGIKRGDTFRVYVSDINTNENWKLYITNDANGWGALAFDDFSGGDLRRDTEGSSSYYHAEDGYGYFEFTCSEETATTLKANGTQMSFTWMTVIKVSYISNNSPEPTKYAITVSPTTNGTVTASAQSAAEGTTVTLTISPASGYELDAISVKDANNTNVTVNMSNYTFTMPSSNVTVSATFALSYSVPEADKNYLTFTTDADYYASNWDSSTNTFTWGPGYQADYWNHPEWTFMAAVGIGSVSGEDLSNWTHLHLHVSNWTNASAKELKVVFKSGGSNEGPTKEIMVYPNASGNIDIDLPPYGGWGNVNGFDITKIFDLTIYGCGRVDPNQDASVEVTDAYYVTAASTTPTEHTITLSYDSSQGSVTVDSGTGKAGDTKWIYITPSSNYVVSSVTTNPYISVIHYGDYQGSDAYYFTMPESNVTVYVSFQLKHRTASIGSSGYATFSCDEALNFAGITSLRAYIAKSIDANWVVLEQVTGTVAANTGLVIVGTTTNIPVANSGTSYSNNLLVPGNGTSVGGTGIYVLTNESGSVKFADTSAHSANVPVGKAYLQAPGTSAARLNIRWEGDATGIKVLKSDFNSDDTIYDLNGQRVITPSKGLYIINGKKVVIK